MTHDQYLEALHSEGFTTKLMWSAQETQDGHPSKSQDSAWCYAIYTPAGRLLTSVVLREFLARSPADGRELAAYFCAENSTVADDIEDLKGLWSKQMRARRATDRRPVWSGSTI